MKFIALTIRADIDIALSQLTYIDMFSPFHCVLEMESWTINKKYIEKKIPKKECQSENRFPQINEYMCHVK